MINIVKVDSIKKLKLINLLINKPYFRRKNKMQIININIS